MSPPSLQFLFQNLCLPSIILLVFYVDSHPNLLLSIRPFKGENSYPIVTSPTYNYLVILLCFQNKVQDG